MTTWKEFSVHEHLAEMTASRDEWKGPGFNAQPCSMCGHIPGTELHACRQRQPTPMLPSATAALLAYGQAVECVQAAMAARDEAWAAYQRARDEQTRQLPQR